MTKFREKAARRTMHIVGQMIGDDQLVQEGKEQERHAEQEAKSSSEHDWNSEPAPKAPAPAPMTSARSAQTPLADSGGLAMGGRRIRRLFKI